ncbi:hypothetical protein ACFL5Q_07645 [Planctomycetota bacterium]
MQVDTWVAAIRNAGERIGDASVSRPLSHKEQEFLAFIFRSVFNPDGEEDIDRLIGNALAELRLHDLSKIPARPRDPEYRMAQSAIFILGNDAITLGRDVYFRRLPPQNSELPLVGHEATHYLESILKDRGTRQWQAEYFIDYAQQMARGSKHKEAYLGIVSELIAFSVDDTIFDILDKYDRLFKDVAKGEDIDAKYPGLRDEIKALFQRHYMRRYRENRRER